MQLIKKLVVCIVTLIFLNIGLLSYSYADNLTIENNGTQSTSGVVVNSSQTTTVSQQNTLHDNTTVNTTANSGNNTAVNNTGGNVSTTTGNISSATNATTVGNTNTAQVAPSQSGSTSVLISGNGSGSTNTLTSMQSNTTSLSQTNSGFLQNNIYTNESSGGNIARSNTSTSSRITTGEALSQTNINAAGNLNTAVVPLPETENITLEIKKNGSNGLNMITVNVPTKIKILSSSTLNLINLANCTGNSGNNSVFQNVGSATLLTGPVSCNERIVNHVNVNKIKLPQQQICQNIPPVTPSNQGSSPQGPSSSNSQNSSSSPSSPSTSSSSPSSGTSLAAASSPVSPIGQVLGVSILPSTGMDMWQSLLFYLAIGIVGIALRRLPQKRFSIHVLLG